MFTLTTDDYQAMGAIATACAVIVSLGLAGAAWQRDFLSKRRFLAAVRSNLARELETVIMICEGYISAKPVLTAVFGTNGEDVYFAPVRPYFEAIAPRLPELPTDILDAVYRYEGSIRKAMQTVTNARNNDERYSATMQLEMVALGYYQAIKGYKGSNGRDKAIKETSAFRHLSNRVEKE